MPSFWRGTLGRGPLIVEQPVQPRRSKSAFPIPPAFRRDRSADGPEPAREGRAGQSAPIDFSPHVATCPARQRPACTLTSHVVVLSGSRCRAHTSTWCQGPGRGPASRPGHSVPVQQGSGLALEPQRLERAPRHDRAPSSPRAENLRAALRFLRISRLIEHLLHQQVQRSAHRRHPIDGLQQVHQVDHQRPSSRSPPEHQVGQVAEAAVAPGRPGTPHIQLQQTDPKTSPHPRAGAASSRRPPRNAQQAPAADRPANGVTPQTFPPRRP